MLSAHFLYFFHCLLGDNLKALAKIAKHANWQWLWEKGKLQDFTNLELPKDLASRLSKLKSKFDSDKAQKKLVDESVCLLTSSSKFYPQLLKQIFDPPVLLYAKGKIEVLKTLPMLAIVGTRRMSPYGEQLCRTILSGLKPYNLTIVSGGAFGVDALAQKLAKEFFMPTVTVLGAGLLCPTPASNIQLFHRLSQNGVLLSEYLPDCPAIKYHFPQRNRIISGLSKATLVIEAPLKSGALITADFALNENREVFACPGHILAPNCQGTNWLIKSKGAQLLDTAKDLVDFLALIPKPKPNDCVSSGYNNGQNQPNKLAQTLLSGPKSLDELYLHTKLPLTNLLSELSRLELLGTIQQIGQMYHFIQPT